MRAPRPGIELATTSKESLVKRVTSAKSNGNQRENTDTTNARLQPKFAFTQGSHYRERNNNSISYEDSVTTTV